MLGDGGGHRPRERPDEGAGDRPPAGLPVPDGCDRGGGGRAGGGLPVRCTGKAHVAGRTTPGRRAEIGFPVLAAVVIPGGVVPYAATAARAGRTARR